LKEINLQDPFQGRRWLRLLQNDQECGFRIQPNVAIPAKDLGFSLRSNSLGLRGPADQAGDSVVFGTSYAMGVAANEGETWHDLALPPAGWLNLGLAVGIREWAELARRHHHGPKKLAFLIYHPNIWAHCVAYERWRSSGRSVFEAFNWKRDLPSCALLAMKRRMARLRQIENGEIITASDQLKPYEIDALYARVDPRRYQDLVDRNLELLRQLLRPFQEVVCVRVPVKQELVPQAAQNAILQETTANYLHYWMRTRDHLSSHPNIRFQELNTFQLADYHAFDSHWNASGNKKFASLFEQMHITCSEERSHYPSSDNRAH